MLTRCRLLSARYTSTGTAASRSPWAPSALATKPLSMPMSVTTLSGRIFHYRHEVARRPGDHEQVPYEMGVAAMGREERHPRRVGDAAQAEPQEPHGRHAQPQRPHGHEHQPPHADVERGGSRVVA